MSTSSHSLQGRLHRFLMSGSAMILGLTVWSPTAWAYRPFDGTDAAVAAPGEVEIELQPAGPRQDEGGTTLFAPVTVFNYGLSGGWEAVLEGQGETPLSPSGPTSLTEAGAFLKHVVVPGSLQDKGWAKRCHRIRCAPSGQHRQFGRRRKCSGHRLAALELGNDPLQRRDRAYPRPSRRCLFQHHSRRAVEMESEAGRGNLLRERVRQGRNNLRARGPDLASGRQSQFRHRISARSHEWTPGG